MVRICNVLVFSTLIRAVRVNTLRIVLAECSYDADAPWISPVDLVGFVLPKLRFCIFLTHFLTW
jgi:hypothetical protein